MSGSSGSSATAVRPWVVPVIDRIHASRKYASIHPDTIRQVVVGEAEVAGSRRELEQRSRRVLHKAAAHYLLDRRPADLVRELRRLSPTTEDGIRAWCLGTLARHRSTAERLDDLERFWPAVLDLIGEEPGVVSDLACGLNPLTVPWLRAISDAPYVGYDFNLDYVALGQALFHDRYQDCDVVHREVLSDPSLVRSGVALLLKTFHCIEARRRGAGLQLVEGVGARHVVVSFPHRSLGGRAVSFTDTHLPALTRMAERHGWTVRQSTLPTEVFAVVDKHEI